MLFNSIDFAIFLPIVFILYWLVLNKDLKIQNLLILGASYIFYGWWDYKFLSLIILSTLIDFSIGLALKKETQNSRRKLFLWISIIANLGFLGFFKYYNFFLTNFIEAFSLFGSRIEIASLDLILPVGISFYTFQTLSYTIDVYNKKLEPTNDFIAFAAFVSFFPQLVAGPIERAKDLLPQFYIGRNFNYNDAVDGLKQILWGLFKKVVIADNCAKFANLIFNNSDDYSGSTLVLGAVFFTFQIYGDFSGYSDIAIGTSRLFGFKLTKNFAFPYFSRDIAEFWRRWHISLSTWFRDYLYIPLGGSRRGTLGKIRNTFIIFIVSGFWHGANWTFIFWGLLNALYFLPLLLTNNNRNNLNVVAYGRTFPSLRELLSILITFCLTVFGWIFFRANNIEHAFDYILTIFSRSLFVVPNFANMKEALMVIILIIFFVFVEWNGRDREYAIETLGKKRKFKYLLYYVLVFMIIFFGSFEENQFIYFQF
ncbi:MBOAT family O-acyltransferase [Aquimarina algicola]|uniref:MBOAT family protein n=1 Tax=Aquimarina algicola TaxID=2589995 RepID=A0A504JHK0_9FLAO|nr:MBOAT family O-acyltransferase [Aquimarina algicola]TPN87885.1 MBOAT family protein [Aquimarina algicola]